MLQKWIGEIVGDMHIKCITKKQLAEHMGYSPEYVSMILNGHRSPKGAEDKFRNAIVEIINSRTEN